MSTYITVEADVRVDLDDVLDNASSNQIFNNISQSRYIDDIVEVLLDYTNIAEIILERIFVDDIYEVDKVFNILKDRIYSMSREEVESLKDIIDNSWQILTK